MDSENLQHKINKYTIKLRNAKSNDRAMYYQKKLQQYHQINKYGGYVDSPISDISDIQNIKIKLDFAIESCRTNPELFSELSKVINNSNNKVIKLSGGNKNNSPPSEHLLNTVQQFFEKSDNLKNITDQSDQENIHE